MTNTRVGEARSGGRLADHQVLIKWESGEKTWEPISEIYKSAPSELADYAMQHDIIDKWDCKSIKIKDLADKSKRMLRLIHRTKMTSHDALPVYMYGVQDPQNHRYAMEMDIKNRDSLWSDSEGIELNQLEEYEYAVKHDGRRKSRLVAGGHLTEVPTESVYSSVVSLRGVRIVIFLAELNKLK